MVWARYCPQRNAPIDVFVIKKWFILYILNTTSNYIWTSYIVFISVFNQLDAQNLFYNKFYFMPLHVSSTCAHHQDVEIALHGPGCIM